MPPEKAPNGDAGQAETTPEAGQGESTQDPTAGQATESDESSNGSEESFTKIDPNTLAPELKEIYNSMLKGFREKTEGIADLRKKADAFTELMGNENFAKLVETFNKGEQTEKNDPTAKEQLANAGLDLEKMSGEEVLNSLLENPKILTDLIRQEAGKLVEPLQAKADLEAAEAQVNGLRDTYSKDKFGDLAFEHYEQAITAEYQKAEKEGRVEYRTAEQIYKDLTWDKVRQSGINQGAKAVEERGKTATTPSSTAPATTKTRVNGFDEAWKAAKEQHNWQGKGN